MSGLGLQAGTIIGRDFRVVQHLASGAMGSVYIVDQLSTGKQRALKVMSLELASNERARDRFVLEARVGANIHSDHVVEVVTAGIDEDTGAPYLVMELLRGEELADKMHRERHMSVPMVVAILKQAGHALEQAHQQGIVHRDIKPENLFVAESRREGVPFTVKILDFGIAKLVAERTAEGTQPVGTPLFMAPEQTDRRGKIGPPTDVWPLGLIAFYLITGQHYWLGASQSITTLLREVVMDPLVPATHRAAELGVGGVLPPGFDQWFMRCVNRDPGERYQEAGSCVRGFCALVPDAGGTFAPAPLQAGATNAQTFPGQATGGATVQGVPPFGGPGVGPNATGPAYPNATAGGTGLTAAASMDTSQKSSKTGLVIGGLLAAVAAGGAGIYFATQPDAPVEASAPAASVETTAPSSSAAAPEPASCAPDMIEVAGGAMFMGSEDEDLAADVRPPHKVKVSRFCMDENEVTVAAYDACAKTGNCLRPKQEVHYPNATEEAVAAFSPLCNYGKADKNDHPMNCVTWSMAKQFCETEGGRLEKGGARLPTEAEWEFAARGSGQRVYPWGDEVPGPKRLNACGTECTAWLASAKMPASMTMFDADDGYPATAPVGSFPDGASSAGILDLAGNVWEWTADWYGPYSAEEQSDPTGPESGETRAVRGGGFNGLKPGWAKPAFRYHTTPDTRSHGIGFRCVMPLPE